MNLRNRIFFVIGTIILLFFITACGSSDSNTSSENDNQESSSSDEPKSVIVGISGSVETLDPADHRNRTTESVLRNIYDGLVRFDENREIEGLIAESWENPTPTEWLFTIKDGIKFHDGSPLTVDDVVFTFERSFVEGKMGGETSPRQGLLGPLSAVEAVDDHTVKFIFDEPWPIFLKMLPHHQIVSKDYIEEVGDEEFRKNPIGAGPYQVVEANLDDRIVLEKFPDYYRGEPNIDFLVFDVIPETSSRVSALQTGEVHRITTLTPDLAEQIQSDENIEIKVVNSTSAYMAEMNVTLPPFDNPNVRRAINHAINMDEIVSSIFGDYVIRLPGPMLTDSYAHDDSLEFYEYDPEKAKQILEEEGVGEDFSLIIDTDANNKEVAEAMASYLRDIGIDANARVWDLAVLRELLLEGERQMYFGTWGNSTLDPYDFLNPKLKTDDRGNYSLYSNSKVDELLEQGDVELDDEKRQAIYKEIQEIIYEDAPWVFGYTVQSIDAGRANLIDWELTADGMLYMPFVDLEE